MHNSSNRQTDPNNVLLSPAKASADISAESEFTLNDVTQVILQLDRAGFDILVFGWRSNGRLSEDNWPD